jgi:regulator of sigma E protease
METFLIRALQLVMSLTLLVVIHEMGHFLFSKIFKVRVEKFYIFFDPWFSLFKFKPKNSDTEFGLGWLPLGGYCKISGMIDESMDTEQMQKPAQSWEFRSKPAWQRLLIMVGGVFNNFILALFIYSMILYAWGDQYIMPQDMTYGMQFSEVGVNAGFRNGDILFSADGKTLNRFPNMTRQIMNAREVTVLRNSQKVSIYPPEHLMNQMMAAKTYFSRPFIPFVIDSVIKGKGMDVAGIKRGDTIVAVNGISTPYYNQYTDYISALQKKKGPQNIKLTVARKGIKDTLSVKLDANYMGGVTNFGLNHYYKIHDDRYNFFASFPAGINLGVRTLKGYVSDMKYVFSKEGAQSLGGFGTIGSIFPPTWDWQAFWSMTAFLSIILAFMNILPIPALDGGHVLFLIYEIVTRRKPSDKFMEYAQVVGMILLFGLLIWANFNDILRLFLK